MTSLAQVMITVVRITNPQELSKAFSIRKEVFVVEQKVDEELEFDEFEDTSHHYLAINDNSEAIGTARWRATPKGIKLERFAVLKDLRGNGVGYSLVKKVLEDAKKHLSSGEGTIYLHSQIKAMRLYQKFGFKPVGKIFEECGILHYKMVLTF